jgi:AcrR family transcriptional regulator
VSSATTATVEPGSAAEREALLRSARAVLRRTGWRNLKMSNVLRDAGLGTRSFYRHFDSKDALLIEVLVAELHEQVESSAAALAALDDPERIVTGWLHRCTDAIDEPEIAEAMRFVGRGWPKFTQERTPEAQALEDATLRPLVDALAAGKKAGSFPAVEPDTDARILWYIVGNATTRALFQTPDRTGADVLAEVEPYVWALLRRPA